MSFTKFGLSPSECENSYSPACLANLNSYGGGGNMYGMTPHFNYFDPSGGYFPTLGVYGLGQFNYQGGNGIMGNIIEILPGVPPVANSNIPCNCPPDLEMPCNCPDPANTTHIPFYATAKSAVPVVALPNTLNDLFTRAKAYAQANPLIALAVGGGVAYLVFRKK